MGSGTKSGSGLLLVVVVGAIVATMGGVSALVERGGAVVDDLLGGTRVYEDAAVMVASDAADKVEECGPVETVRDQECGGLRFVVLDAKRLPYIARNISLAWEEGKPGVLTRGDDGTILANRKVVCTRTFQRRFGGSCDEYPFASTVEGGEGAREDEVPRRENACQGGTISSQYGRLQIKRGDQFGVILRYPDAIPDEGYTGTDLGAGC